MRLWHNGLNPKRRKHQLSFLIILLVTIGILASFLLIEMRLKPYVLSIATTRAKNIASDVINKAVTDELASENIEYNDLILLQTNNSGMVTALQSNIPKINKLKSSLALAIQENITNIESTDISVPLGNLINGDITSGLGPKIPIKLLPIGSINIDFQNGFESAGINQTKHEIYLVAKASITILIPSASTTSDVETIVPVAQTIIVGSVPQTYANIEGLDGGVSGKSPINNTN